MFRNIDQWQAPYSVLTLLIVGLTFRLLLFNAVVVNLDAGLYLYDATLICRGLVPLVDFPTRSPAFHYILAGVLSLGFSPIYSVRILMICIALVLGMSIYLFTTQIHSRTAGLAALAIFMVTPFPAIWGLWVKTEPAVEAVILFGLLPFVTRWGDSWPRLSISLFTGGAFGFAFLIRRVVVVHAAAFGIFLLYDWFRHQDRDIITFVIHAVALFGGFLIVLGGGYAALAGFSPQTFWALVDLHFIGLVYDPPVTGVVWTDGATKGFVESASDSAGGSGCRLCLKRALRTTMRTVIVALPAVLLLTIYPVSWAQRSPNPKLIGGLMIIGATIFFTVYGLVAKKLFLITVIVAISVLSFVLLIIYLDLKDLTLPDSSIVLLPAYILGMLLLGYLIRERQMFMTYYQDMFPWVAILAGMAVGDILQNPREWPFEWRKTRSIAVVLLNVLLVTLFVVGIVYAYPVISSPAIIKDTTDTGMISPRKVQKSSTELQTQVLPSKIIFTAQPVYVVEADRRLVSDFSRKYYYFTRARDAKITAQMNRRIAHRLSSSHVGAVLIEHRTRNILETSSIIKQQIESGYCISDNQGSFTEVEATLYVKRESGNCR